MSDYEVVRSDVEGWDVRRVGETQALSNYPTRELAEQAAQREQDAESFGASSPHPVEVHSELHSEAPEEELNLRRVLLIAGLIALTMIVLIAVIAIVTTSTGFPD